MSDKRDEPVGRPTRRRAGHQKPAEVEPKEPTSGARGSGASARRGRTPPPGPPNGSADGSHRSRSRRRWLAALVTIAISVALVAGLAWYRLSPPAAAPSVQEFEVQPGWGASRVASELEAEGLIRDDLAFSLLLRVRGIDRQVGEGVYDLSPHLSASEIADRLARGGRPRTVALLVPEGFRMPDVAQRLAELGLADATAALERMRTPGDLRPSFVPEGLGLEGYLFPASYEVEVDAETDAVLRRMIDRFRAEVGPTETDRLVDLGLHVHDWVTLASMVQSEAADESEMAIIAGVFLNRLDRDMRLQSDPTVAYGLGKDLPDLDAVAGDMRRDHPWNTYTRAGLPLGPIGNPGTAALQAVLAPQRTNDAGTPYLFFLHGFDDGEPVFRPNTSLEAHERDIDRYLR